MNSTISEPRDVRARSIGASGDRWAAAARHGLTEEQAGPRLADIYQQTDPHHQEVQR